MKPAIIGGFGKRKPDERPGYVAYRHSNGRWYLQRVADRGNEPRGGRRARKKIKVGVVR